MRRQGHSRDVGDLADLRDPSLLGGVVRSDPVQEPDGDPFLPSLRIRVLNRDPARLGDQTVQGADDPAGPAEQVFRETVVGEDTGRVGLVHPDQWRDLAYEAWAAAQGQIADEWNENLDVLGQAGPVAPAVREAVRHLHLHGKHRDQQTVDLAIKVFSRGQASRVTSIIKAVMRDDDLTDRTRTDRLIELVDELGLSVPETKPKRFPIEPTDVHLIAWMALIPPDDPIVWEGEARADGTRLT